MFKRILPVLLLAAAPLLLNQAQAQQAPDQPPVTPEQQAMMDSLQAIRDQALTNMQNQGIDPQDFANQMQQQFQSGNFDPEAMQQMLINQGIISQDMLNQVQGTVRNLALSQIRQQLGSTDEEWGVVQAKLQRVVTAMADAEQDQLGRISGRTISGQQGNSEMDKARKALKAAIAEPNVSEETLLKAVANWRVQHEKAKVELVAARADLLRIVTLRQEAILLGMGVL